MSDFFDDDAFAARTRRRRRNPWLARLALGVTLVVFVAMVAWGALSLIGEGKSTKRQVASITLVAPPPPPPPPPPPEVKPPEPEVQEEVKVPEPDPAPQAEEPVPAGEQLGLDVEGSGSGDGFGLAAKKGGPDITRLGETSGNARVKFAYFTGMVQSFLQEQLHKNSRLRSADYRVVVRLWFGDDGAIDRYELVGSTGDAEIDKNLSLAMEAMPALRQPPPADLPQPVKLRVTSRGAG